MPDKPFQILEYFPRFTCEPDGESGWKEVPANSDGRWSVVATTSISTAWLFETTIDLGGFTREDLTAFFANQSLQRASPYGVVGVPNPTGGLVMDDVVVISDVPLDTTAWFAIPFTTPGFLRANSDYMTIKFGQGVQLAQSSTTQGIMLQTDGYSFGSADPTAAAKLYCYRWVGVQKPAPASPGDLGVFPELRYIASGITDDEPEFVYLNRLRRSYELQQL
jgi:hypothetical protein